MPSRSARNRVRRVLDAACVMAICINVAYIIWHNKTYTHVKMDQHEAEERGQYSNNKYAVKDDVSTAELGVINRNPLRHVVNFSDQRNDQAIEGKGGQNRDLVVHKDGMDTGQLDHRIARHDLDSGGQLTTKESLRAVDSQIGQHAELSGHPQQKTANNGSKAIGQMVTALGRTNVSVQLGTKIHDEDLNLSTGKQTDINSRRQMDQRDDTRTRADKQEREATTLTKDVQESELCPLMPDHLNGALRCECNETSPEFLLTKYPEIIKGGRIRPHDCLPREQVAIIIPYRDRSSHLHKLLQMLIPILTRQNVDATFYVIEQSSPILFNRGALHNIGFLESLKLGSYDCFIFHDVDMMPVNDKLLYRCADKPTHFSAAIKYHGVKTYFMTMYDDNFGGVVGFTRDQYLAINGNSNLYFGWGGEDDDLYERVKNKNMSRVRYAPEVARYEMLVHQRQEKISANPTRVEMLKSSRTRQAIDGLNTIQYKVNDVQLQHLYTWVNVDINMRELFQNAPIFMQRSIRAMNGLLKRMLNTTQTS